MLRSTFGVRWLGEESTQEIGSTAHSTQAHHAFPQVAPIHLSDYHVPFLVDFNQFFGL